jgi:hypothetical protein
MLRSLSISTVRLPMRSDLINNSCCFHAESHRADAGKSTRSRLAASSAFGPAKNANAQNTLPKGYIDRASGQTPIAPIQFWSIPTQSVVAIRRHCLFDVVRVVKVIDSDYRGEPIARFADETNQWIKGEPKQDAMHFSSRSICFVFSALPDGPFEEFAQNSFELITKSFKDAELWRALRDRHAFTVDDALEVGLKLRRQRDSDPVRWRFGMLQYLFSKFQYFEVLILHDLTCDGNALFVCRPPARVAALSAERALIRNTERLDAALAEIAKRRQTVWQTRRQAAYAAAVTKRASAVPPAEPPAELPSEPLGAPPPTVDTSAQNAPPGDGDKFVGVSWAHDWLPTAPEAFHDLALLWQPESADARLLLSAVRTVALLNKADSLPGVRFCFVFVCVFVLIGAVARGIMHCTGVHDSLQTLWHDSSADCRCVSPKATRCLASERNAAGSCISRCCCRSITNRLACARCCMKTCQRLLRHVRHSTRATVTTTVTRDFASTSICVLTPSMQRRRTTLMMQ